MDKKILFSFVKINGHLIKVLFPRAATPSMTEFHYANDDGSRQALVGYYGKEFVTDLDLRGQMIIFVSILTTFESSSTFGGS